MSKLPQTQRLTYGEWEKNGGQKKYTKRVEELNDSRKREGKVVMKFVK